MVKQVVLVGHCGADSHFLKLAIQRAAPAAAIESAYDLAAVQKLAAADSLLLINRVLPGSYGVRSGVELIHQFMALPMPPAMMLVSDFAAAQAEAVAAGALPGFGKSQLDEEQTLARLRQATAG